MGLIGPIRVMGRQHSVGCRERPQDAGIEDGTLLCLGVQYAVAVNTTIETSMLVVLHLVEPEAQDVVLQHILHFTFDGLSHLSHRFHACSSVQH